MRGRALVFILFALTSCKGGNGLRGWFPGWEEAPVVTNQTGCRDDLTVKYKNNCGRTLIAYFIEVLPGSSFKCESLESIGIVLSNETKSVLIHKGKLGYIVFSLSEEGQCSAGQRKFEAWIDCNNATGEATFNICQ